MLKVNNFEDFTVNLFLYKNLAKWIKYRGERVLDMINFAEIYWELKNLLHLLDTLMKLENFLSKKETTI